MLLNEDASFNVSRFEDNRYICDFNAAVSCDIAVAATLTEEKEEKLLYGYVRSFRNTAVVKE